MPSNIQTIQETGQSLVDSMKTHMRSQLVQRVAEIQDLRLNRIEDRLGHLGDDFEGSPADVALAKERLRGPRPWQGFRTKGIRVNLDESLNLQKSRRLLFKCVADARPDMFPNCSPSDIRLTWNAPW